MKYAQIAEPSQDDFVSVCAFIVWALHFAGVI